MANFSTVAGVTSSCDGSDDDSMTCSADIYSAGNGGDFTSVVSCFFTAANDGDDLL